MMNADKQTELLTLILGRLDGIDAKVDHLASKLDAIAQPVLRVTTRKESRTQQAKRLGVHRNTLLARERRERIRLMADGRLVP